MEVKIMSHKAKIKKISVHTLREVPLSMNDLVSKLIDLCRVGILEESEVNVLIRLINNATSANEEISVCDNDEALSENQHLSWNDSVNSETTEPTHDFDDDLNDEDVYQPTDSRSFSFIMYGYVWEIIMNGKAHYCGNTELDKVPITVNCRNAQTGEIITASCACFKSNDIFHSECMSDSVAIYNVIINHIPGPDAYGDVVIRNGQNSYHIPHAHLHLIHVTIASVILLLAIDAYMRINHINYETAISSHISPITKLVMKITEVIKHCNEWADDMCGYMRNANIL